MTPRHLVCFVFLAICLSAISRAETTPPTTLDIPAAAQPSPNFDVKAATDAWLATIPPDKKARSDSYFEGGYWLQLWDFLLFSAIILFFLHTDLSAHIRDWAARTIGNIHLQTLLYVLPFILITFLLQFPMSV